MRRRRRLPALLAAAVALAACAPPAAEGDGALALSIAPAGIAAPAEGPLALSGAIALRSQDPRFGGLSGFALDPDGEGFVAVSDAGYWAVGRLIREDGRLAGAKIARYERMRGPDGAPMARALRDAEEVVRDPAGGWLVSFERAHRVSRFAEVGAPEGPAFRADGWRGMQLNSGIEALVAAPGGPVHALKEGRLPDRPGTPVWVVGGSGEVAARLPLRGHDYVTAADFGPDGRLYVLERRFSLFGGFTVHIQRYPRLPEGEADAVEPERLLTLTAADGSDNFEGLEVWRDAAGATRLTILSDDNFNPLQRTLIVEFVLRD